MLFLTTRESGVQRYFKIYLFSILCSLILHGFCPYDFLAEVVWALRGQSGNRLPPPLDNKNPE